MSNRSFASVIFAVLAVVLLAVFSFEIFAASGYLLAASFTSSAIGVGTAIWAMAKRDRLVAPVISLVVSLLVALPAGTMLGLAALFVLAA